MEELLREIARMESDKRSFYRVPCEVQLRMKRMTEDEFKVFRSFAMRPSAYSTMRNEIENQLRSLGVREDSKSLFERAFQLLMSIDQRLERLEEAVQQIAAKDSAVLESYEWVAGDLGAGGFSFQIPENAKKEKWKDGDKVLLDMILPALPDFRFVAAAEVVRFEDDQKKLSVHFVAINEDDKEFIHRFVITRERELLRQRAQAKKSEI